MLKNLAQSSAVRAMTRRQFSTGVDKMNPILKSTDPLHLKTKEQPIAYGVNGIKQSLLDTFEPRVFDYFSKADVKMVQKLNVLPQWAAFKLNSATNEQLKKLQAETLWETVATLEDPWIKEWKKNGSDPDLWLASLKTCYGSIETANYCWRMMKVHNVFPMRPHYKVMIDIEARAGHIEGAGTTAGELRWNNNRDKPDDEVYNILLRMGLDLKDWRLANDQYLVMKSLGYKPDPALEARLQELGKVWDMDVFSEYILQGGPKPAFLEEAENEVINRLKVALCGMPFSPEPLEKRFARLRTTGYYPEELLQLPQRS